MYRLLSVAEEDFDFFSNLEIIFLFLNLIALGIGSHILLNRWWEQASVVSPLLLGKGLVCHS